MAVEHPKRSHHRRPNEVEANPLFERGGMTKVPRWRLPKGQMLPQTAYQIVRDETMLDGNAKALRIDASTALRES